MSNRKRCGWCGKDPLYVRYHDTEWGVPVYNDRKIFEFLVLEGAQAGLSWLTVLRKREAYRKAFDGFDFTTIANYNEEKIQELLENPGIIRNQLKIRSVIRNAKAFIDVRREFGTFKSYIWSFVDGKPVQNYWESPQQIPARTELSGIISKDLKKRGFGFVGSTIVYAHMQATGMVNDHITGCFRYQAVKNMP